MAAKDRFVIWSTGGKKVDRGVLSGKIGFTQKQQVWFVGLEIVSKKHGEDQVQMIVHLREFPVHGIDVRNEPFRIRLDRGSNFATALGRGWLTNLYYYEHTETEANDIVVAPLAKNRYRVKWSAAGESMSDHFTIDCVASLTRKLRYA